MISMHVVRYKLEDDSNWVIYEESNRDISFDRYENIVNAKSFFESINGTEEHLTKNINGEEVVYKIISKSPSNDLKTIYEFNF